MGLGKETHESLSNDATDGQKQGAAADAREQGRRAAGQKYNPANTLEHLARQVTTKEATQSAMGAHAKKQASKPTFRKQTVITKDEPYQPGM